MKSGVYLLLFFLMLFLYACKCGLNIKLGEINLAESSRQFIPYTGNETLIFEDNEGGRHKLKSTKGKEFWDLNLLVRKVCDESALDQQFKYYETQREQISFFDTLGRIIFYLDLNTNFEDAENLDSIAIYDFLLISSSINGNNNGSIQIFTEERQNQVSDYHKNEFWEQSEFIGDTILYGTEFKDVYMGAPVLDRRIFYNKEKGVVAFRMTDEAYWVLKN